jgi:hypothetical protein
MERKFGFSGKTATFKNPGKKFALIYTCQEFFRYERTTLFKNIFLTHTKAFSTSLNSEITSASKDYERPPD